jgi:hypothetical protein
MLILKKIIPNVNNLTRIYSAHEKSASADSIADKIPYEKDRDVTDVVVKVSVFMCTYIIGVVHS